MRVLFTLLLELTVFVIIIHFYLGLKCLGALRPRNFASPWGRCQYKNNKKE
jgi:hypothetical protein